MKKSLAVILCIGMLIGTVGTSTGCARVAFSDGGLNTGLNSPDDGNNGNGGNPTDPPGSGDPTDPAPTCSLDGVWQRCTGNALLATREIYTFVGNVLQRTTELFIGDDTCSGTPTTTTLINADIQLGTIGASLSIGGATDLDITAPLLDLGCGIGNTSYTALQLSADCNELRLSTGLGCNPSNRGTALDVRVFSRQ